MKKIICFIAFIMAMLVSVNAQTSTVQDSIPSIQVEQNAFEYCEIVGTSAGLFTNKVTIEINYGQESSFFADKRYRNEEGEIVKFNSMVDALNFMGKQGWKLEQAFAITHGNQNVYHFLLIKTNK